MGFDVGGDDQGTQAHQSGGHGTGDSSGGGAGGGDVAAAVEAANAAEEKEVRCRSLPCSFSAAANAATGTQKAEGGRKQARQQRRRRVTLMQLDTATEL